jgi:hypothetical protein
VVESSALLKRRSPKGYRGFESLPHRVFQRRKRENPCIRMLTHKPGVEPVIPKKDQAIDYAQNRACFRSGEIRVLDSSGNVERTIPFTEANRKL